jgi:hypothetical protein
MAPLTAYRNPSRPRAASTGPSSRGSSAWPERHPTRTSGRDARLLLVPLLVVLSAVPAGATSKREALGNAEPRSRDCDAIEGLFRSAGRYEPDLPIWAPVPDRHPNDPESSNYIDLADAVLECRYPCDPHPGLRWNETSFALSYRSGVLRWMGLQSPTGRVVARGEMPWKCEEGILRRRWTEWTAPFEHPTMTFGRVNIDTYLTVNTDGWLVRYVRQSGYAALFGVIPVAGSSWGGWVEFPPDPLARLDVAAAVADWEPPAAAGAVPGAATTAPAEDPEPPGHPKTLLLHEGEWEQYDGLTLTLEETGVAKRRDGYYDSHAVLVVRLGSQREEVSLRRDDSGDRLEYVRVFDRRIALDEAYVKYSRPHTARILMLPADPTALQGPRAGADPLRQVLVQDSPVRVDDALLTLESVAYEPLGDHDEGHVSIRAERDGIVESLDLSRRLPGDVVYEPLFDYEVALESAIDYYRPRRAAISLRRTQTSPPAAGAARTGASHEAELLLARLRALLDGLASAPVDAMELHRLDVEPLIGTSRDEIVRVLGDPWSCAGSRAGAGQRTCRSVAGAGGMVYVFYRLPPGSRGGGPELHLEFGADGRCAAAAWRSSQ